MDHIHPLFMRLERLTAFLGFLVSLGFSQSLLAQNAHYFLTSTLLAGKNHPIGKVTISNSASDVTIHMESALPWRMKSIRILAGLTALSNNSWQFQHKEAFGDRLASSHTEKIPFSSLGVTPGKTLLIAINTEMTQAGGENSNYSTETETGWAFGPWPLPGTAWGWSLSYTISPDIPSGY